MGTILRWDLIETGRDGMNWIDLAEVMDSCEHGNEPAGSIKCFAVHE
jgi:hypothetical protein